MPRRNTLRIRQYQRQERRTNARDIVLATRTIIQQWNDHLHDDVSARLRPPNLARIFAGKCADWFDIRGHETQRRQRLRALRAMRQTLVRWYAPAHRGGRCRRAPDLAAVWCLLDTVDALYSLYCGQKRATDLIWTKYLPPGVQARVLRENPFGSSLHTYLHNVVAWAQGHLHQAVLYAIVSRKHQKWYLGKHEQVRHVNNKEVDGHPERRG